MWRGEEFEIYSVKSTHKCLHDDDDNNNNKNVNNNNNNNNNKKKMRRIILFFQLWKIKTIPNDLYFVWKNKDNLSHRGLH